MNKVSYPMKEESIEETPFDIEKWVQILKAIEITASNGKMSFANAFNHFTRDGNMDSIEREHFSQWVKFYKANSMDLYKSASFYYAGDEGYGFPINKPNSMKLDDNNLAKDMELLEEQRKKEEQEKHNSKLRMTKKKLVSRLDSLEKLIRSEEGQELIDDEIDYFIEEIFELKKKIHKLNKASANFYEDMLICMSGKANLNGLYKSAALFIALSDVVKNDKNQLTKIACDISFNELTDPKLLYLISVAQDSAPVPTPTDSTDDGDAIDFLKELIDPVKAEDKNKDKNNSKDDIALSELDIPPQEMKFNDVGYGSSSGSLNNLASNVNNLISLADITENPNDIKKENSNFDNILDSALKQVKVEDIIKKLEMISNIHHIREISRQLALVDIMLQVLGLGGLFPSLSEAMNKSLESSNYISSRVDEVLANLRTVVNKSDIDLEKEPTITDDKAKDIKNKLNAQKAIEEERKLSRKKLEDEKTKLDSPDAVEENIELAEEPTEKPNISSTIPTTLATPAKSSEIPVKPQAKI